jgi:hypothetical protein
LAESRVALAMALLTWAVWAAPGRAAEPPPAMPVSEIRAGMRGWGETVFVGATPERFEVEVLGVLRAVAPGTDYVLARFSGHDLERTGVIAGMSGSPVWIDGRVVGAVAFAWPFATEAIGGITPIAAMREIPRAGALPGEARPVVSLADLAARKWPADLLGTAAARLASAPGLDARAAVSWGAGGFSDAGLTRLSRVLPALSPVAVGHVEGGATPPAGFGAGSSVAAVLIDGDLRLAATGTITERDGDDVLAFGHPLAGLGEVSLPLAPAEVVTVLPSRYSSFKLANAGDVVGEFVRDHATGAFGHLGVVPRTVPFDLTVAGATPRRFHLRLARVRQFLPLLAAVGAMGAVDATASAGGVQGLDFALTADLGVHGRLTLAQSFDGAGAVGDSASYLFTVLDFLVHNEFAPVELAGLRLDLVPWTQPRTAELVGAHLARTRVEPGETLDLYVDLRDWRGGPERRTLPVTVPDDLPAGRYVLVVGDGTSLDPVRMQLEPAPPQTFEQALAWLSSLGTPREIGVLGVMPGRGLAVAGEVLPRLPASLASIWAASGGGGARPLRLAIEQRLRFPEPRPVSGLVRVVVEVRRPLPSSGDAPEPTARPAPAGTGHGAQRAAPAGQGRGRTPGGKEER